MTAVWNGIMLMLACVLLTTAPLLTEYLRFRHDRVHAMTYKRLRTAVFSVFYMIVVTLVLFFLKEIPQFFQKLPVLPWIVNLFAPAARTVYLTEVLAVVLLNAVIGILFGVLQSFVRIGLKKKDLLTPKKKNNTFRLSQKTERRILTWFHTETWFFIGEILKWFALVLSVFYALQFALWLLPGLFDAAWIPYRWISALFEAGYLFPIITLLPLCEWYYFLEGIRLLETECPEFFQDKDGNEEKTKVCLDQLDEEVRSVYGSHCMGIFGKHTGGDQ